MELSPFTNNANGTGKRGKEGKFLPGSALECERSLCVCVCDTEILQA